MCICVLCTRVYVCWARVARDFIYEQYPITQNLRLAVIIETHLDILPIISATPSLNILPHRIDYILYLVLRHRL